MGVQISLWDNDLISFRYIQKWGLLDHMLVLFLIFLRNLIPFSIMLYQFTFLPVNESSFLNTSFLTLVLSCLFDKNHPIRCEVITSFWFWLIVPSCSSMISVKPVNPKGNQSWIFIGRTDAEAKAPILWTPDAKSWRIGKDPDAGKDWGQEKGTTEDEMVGWHHWLNGHEFEQVPGIGDGWWSLVCCSPWGCRVGHEWATELNN